MNIKRVGVLLGKEFIYGPKNFLFIFAIIIPVVISLVITLLLGSVFSGKPRFGYYDDGNSLLVSRVSELDYIISRGYNSSNELKLAIENGSLDMGVVLPAGFDENVSSGNDVHIDLYIWGESLLKNRTLLGITLVKQIIELAGREIPVETSMVLLGDNVSIPWDERLFPLIVIMTIILGGSMVPATSLVDEKQKRTLRALTITPASFYDVLVSKGILGVLLSLGMGIVILILNQVFGINVWLLLLVLTLSAVLAAQFGVLLGMVLKDVNTLFTVLKATGILLYAPAIVYMFPDIPEWVGRLFPTYYMIGPIVELSLRGASWADIAIEVFILGGLILLMFAVLYFAIRKMRDSIT